MRDRYQPDLSLCHTCKDMLGLKILKVNDSKYHLGAGKEENWE